MATETVGGLMVVPEIPLELREQSAAWKDEVTLAKQKATELVIYDAEAAERASERLTANLFFQDTVELKFAPTLKLLNDAKKSVTDLMAEVLGPAKDEEKLLRKALTDWTVLQKRITDEQNRVARENAQKVAEEQSLQVAQTAEAHGASKEVVDGLLSTPPVLTRVAPQVPVVGKTKGITPGTNWHAEIDGYTEDGEILKAPTSTAAFLELVRAVAADPRMIGYLQPNMVALNQAARSLRTTLAIPGVKAVGVPKISAKRR